MGDRDVTDRTIEEFLASRGVEWGEDEPKSPLALPKTETAADRYDALLKQLSKGKKRARPW